MQNFRACGWKRNGPMSHHTVGVVDVVIVVVKTRPAKPHFTPSSMDGWPLGLDSCCPDDNTNAKTKLFQTHPNRCQENRYKSQKNKNSIVSAVFWSRVWLTECLHFVFQQTPLPTAPNAESASGKVHKVQSILPAFERNQNVPSSQVVRVLSRKSTNALWWETMVKDKTLSILWSTHNSSQFLFSCDFGVLLVGINKADLNFAVVTVSPFRWNIAGPGQLESSQPPSLKDRRQFEHQT